MSRPARSPTLSPTFPGPAVRFAILGTGTVARAFAEDLRLVAGARLTAVGSRSIERAQAFAREFAAAHAHSAVDDLAHDAEVDVVYVATPHSRHHDDCLACLNGGRAVLCEKPFTVDHAQAQSVIAAAREHGLFCMEAMWMRFHPLILKTQSLIASGALGDIRLFRADFGYTTPFDPESRFFNRALAGGALLDRGVYPLSLAHFLLGKPDEIVGRPFIGETGVDEQFSALLTYSSGTIGIVTATLRSRLRNEAVVIGTKGSIEIRDPFFAPRQIVVKRFHEPVAADVRPGGGRLARLKRNPILGAAFERVGRPILDHLRNRGERFTHHEPGNGYEYEAAEVVRRLQAGETESPIMSLNDTLNVMADVDALRGSWNLLETSPK